MRGTILEKAAPVFVAAAVFAAPGCDDDGTGPELEPSQIQLVSGGGQEGTVASQLGDPVVIVVTDVEGTPVPDVTVTWNVDVGGALVQPSASSTNADGRTQATWTLGTVAGEQELQAMVDDVPTLSVFAEALPGPPETLEVESGDEQEGAVGEPLPDELTVGVSDEFGNPVEGVEVTWTATVGDGTVDPASGETDGDGLASTQWTLGPEAGEQEAEAAATGLDPVTFTATAELTLGSIEVTQGEGQEATVGEELPESIVVLVTDDEGNPAPDVTVAWSTGDEGASVDPEEAITDGDGLAETSWTLGTVAGEQTLSAGAGSLSPLEITATALPGSASQIEAEAGDEQVGDAEEALPDSLVARVTDEHGNPVEGIEVTWAVTAGGGSVSPETYESDEVGLARTEWTLGEDAGEQTVEASIPGASVEFTATSEAPPELESISPETLVAGETGTLTGSNFSPEPTENTVTVAGVAVDVTSASSTTLEISLPARGEFDCAVTGPVSVIVEVDGLTGDRSHPLQVARQIELDPGEALTILDLDDVECNEIPETGGTYVMSAFHASSAPEATIAFELFGDHPGGEGSMVADATNLAPAAAGRPIRATGGTGPEIDDFARGHAEVMEMNRRLYEEMGPPPRAGAAPTSSIASLENGLPSVGDVLEFRIPDMDSNNTCTNYIGVEARAVYVGSHGIVFEDIDAPLAEDMDDTYELIGQEYDNVQHDIIVDHFGDPLAYDAEHMSDVGRVIMLFSEVVNDFDRSVAGFVSSADFRPREGGSSCASSDEVEIFYARVATEPEAEGGFEPGMPQHWRWIMRSTVIHEVKHIASFAARISSAASFEESWLEEATARASEELFAREIFEYDRGDRTTYDESIHCEVRPTWPECEDSPVAMLVHFAAVHDYYDEIEAFTPIGNFDLDPDAIFYGAGWLLTRWAADHFAGSDSEFYSGLNQSTLTGIDNLEAQTGESWEEILAHWTLTLAVDERPGFTAADPTLDVPTWDTRDVFEGMTELSSFDDPFPLAVRNLSFGTFTETVESVRGGTTALFEISGTQAGPQLLHLRAEGGGLPPEALRAAIVRVE